MKLSILSTFILYFVQMHSQIIDNKSVTINTIIPEVALIDIESVNQSVLLNLQPNNNSGEQLNTSLVQDNSTWINYTCSLAQNSPSKKISVQIISGEIPKGIEILLLAGNYQGSEIGNHGISNGTVILNNFPQSLISNIGASLTGEGLNNGHQLNYSLRIIDYGLLDFEDSTSITISFTLTDD